jgi:Cu-Zn family superoxide dismutase
MNGPTLVLAAIAAATTLAAGATPAAAAPPVRTTAVLGVTAGSYVYGNALPVGARAVVHATTTASGSTIVTLHVYGLEPNREYGAHAHRAVCGANPLDAGGHFQHVLGGATDPAYANPSNEIWLDFTTDAEGNGASQAVQGWTFTADSRPHSVVIHDHLTATEPGVAGTAGPRLACMTVEF